MKLILAILLLFMVYSCGDNNQEENSETCKPACSEWQNCNIIDFASPKCVVNIGKCNNNDDCNLGFECDVNIHECKEVVAICDPICDDSWQKCKIVSSENTACVSKENFCFDNTECLNGFVCDTDHKCIADCEEVFDECALSDKLCDGNDLKLCEETSCGRRYKISPCGDNKICSLGECIDPNCINECELGEKKCSGYNKVKLCEETDCGNKFTETTCTDNKGCLQGECSSDYCSDECNPNEENCDLWDMKTSAFVTTDQNNILYDRGQEYLRELYSKNMIFGGVAEAFFQDENLLETINYYGGVGDSAIWTGTYLGAESFRYMATGSFASYKNIKNLINTLHLWFNVTGEDGLLARYAAKTSLLNTVDAIGDLKTCDGDYIFCNVDYNGESYNYKGHISRDQYQGIWLGYSLAYTALGNSTEELELKAIIRDDIIELVKQLMKETELDVEYEIYDDRIPDYLGGSPLTGTKKINARFVVTSSREQVAGKVKVKYCSVETPECETNFTGFQEFMPDLKPFLNQLSGVLGFLPAIPRSGSGVMLSTIFNIAMQVTRDIEGFENDYNEIKNFYYNNNDTWGNTNDWIDMAAYWEYLGECGDKYYGINITMEPLYNLLRLEQNQTLRDKILNDVLVSQFWEEVENHKNPFFSYIYLSAFQNTDASILEIANEQVTQFTTTPKRHFAVDLLDVATYPQYSSREGGCDNQVNHDTAVDVKDREMSDFMWQRKPWALLSGANPRRIYPGVDYLMVYWMGRYYNFLEEDSDSRCFIKK